MFIFELQYKLKPGVDINELERIFEELAAPIYLKIPGLLSYTNYKYLAEGRFGDKEPEWDYVLVEVWETKEAHDKAEREKLIGPGPDTEVSKTGFTQKAMAMAEKFSGAFAIPIASLK